MSTSTPDVLVVGAGVSGLSSAICLLDAGLTVTIYAAAPPHLTTSAVAGALWGPHLVGLDDRVTRWAGQTLDRLRELAADPAAGIRETAGLAATLDNPQAGQPQAGPPQAGQPQAGPPEPEPPGFLAGVGALRRCGPESLPRPYLSGWRYTAPVVAMPAYLDYLLGLVLGKGGELHLGRPLRDLGEAAGHCAAPVIVNCAGAGARDLVPDAALIPVRGQVVVVANPGLTEFFVGELPIRDEAVYFFPHGPTMVLGGTEHEGDASTLPDPATAARIVARCAGVEPRLAGVPVLAHRVGTRPVRPAVRLEAQQIAGRRLLIHNYGHGGAGVTLSWGCAQAVADEVARPR